MPRKQKEREIVQVQTGPSCQGGWTLRFMWSAILGISILAAGTAGAQTASRISPTAGSTAGSGRMDILGAGLSSSATVSIGGQSAPVIGAFPDGSQVTVTIPPGAQGPADVVITAGGNATTFHGGYTYLDPSVIAFADDFNSGALSNWSASPLGLFGNWGARNDVADYNGGGHTQIYAGSSAWTDYTLQAKFQLFSLNNWPGGIRGRVNLSTGASYTAWLYPASSTIKLFRTGGWNIDNSGLVLLSQASVNTIAPNVFHTLQMAFSASQITVSYDGAAIIQANDSALSSGAIALDVSNQHIQFDDVIVTTVPADTTPPVVSITAPASGATVSGTTTVSAAASDNVGVAGVQFLLDGANLGAEVTASPYSISWDTTAAGNGAHTISARARDAAGNTATAGNITITVSNSIVPTLTGVSVSPSSVTLPPAATQQLTVTAQYSDGSTQNVTGNTSYSSSNTGAATVSATGLVTTGSGGSATITAAFNSKSATAGVTVSTAGPAITRISSTAGASAGGGQLDVIGSNLSGAAVIIGGQSASFISGLADGSRLSVKIPAGNIGSADVVATSSSGSATLAGGYIYLDPTTILFADDFNTGLLSNWSSSPLGLFSNWSAAADLADYNGNGHTQIYAGSAAWTDYTVQTKFLLFSASNYPGGLRGRVNLSNGTAYAAWLYPASSMIKLFRTGGWNIDSPGLVLLGQATVANMAPNVFHSLSLNFSGTQITVTCDGTDVIQVTDGTLPQGAIALDVSDQHIQFDDVLVTRPVPDTTPPTVSLTAPSSGASVSGTISVTANAADNVKVAGVQFLLDGSNLGSEVTTSPYSVSWNTTTVTNGAHTLSARARDAAGNTATAANVAVTVANAPPPALTGISVSPSSFSMSFTGAQQSLSVIAGYSDGSSEDVTALASYSTSNSAVATVAGGGVVTAADSGSTTIIATYGGFSVQSAVTVSLLPPVVERLSPPAGSANGGNRLDLIGNNLSSSMTVTVGGQSAVIAGALPNGEQLTVITPAGTVGPADVVAANGTGSVTIKSGYQYLQPSTMLFNDDFNLGNFSNWTLSPMGLFGNWNASADVADYNGGGHTQLYAGSGSWSNYSVQAKFQLFSASNYPGGLRGRVNLNNGVAYEAWLLPATSQIKLYRVGGWNIDSPGLTLLGLANVPYMSPDEFHTLQLVFNGPQITLLLDGPAVLQVNDALLASGAIALDVSDQHIQFDDVLVTTIPVDTIPPLITLTAPALGSTISGATTIAATASDNVGVAGVQFMIDGAFFGPELTVAPYSIAWNTANAANGAHTLTAMARDASGNITTSASLTVTVANNYVPSQSGQWTAPFNWPVVAINLAVLKTGEVISWDGPPADGGASVTLWNPGTRMFTSMPNTASNMFCDGQTELSDGRLLTAGGHADWGVGIPNADIYDPVTRLWTKAASMSFGRWYPTLTTLPDGRVLAVSGSDRCEFCVVPTPEIYDPAANTWTQLTKASQSLPLYPFLFVLPDGRVLQAGSVGSAIATQVLDLSTQQWTVVDSNVVDGHSAVMYQPGKVMKSGTASTPNLSSAPAQPVTFVLDMTQPTPKWQQTASMNFARAFQNLTLLPDGAVLATGGESTQDGTNYANAVLPAEMWSPATETWTTMASEQTGRLYHSSAVLLLDGRVLVAGSGRAGVAPELNAEIYSPPYLFHGPRPAISSAPTEAVYGSSFQVGTPDAASISSVSLIRLSAATHSFNMDQRFLSLAFQQSGNGLTVQAPANANLAPPGYYAVFIVNSNGVPSVGSVIKLP
ncbi:MAG TPA: Ig-like domain-containing protein [Terriglobales bacterium]|nr:Ig-like domain-containing protein [Terriglobales bacterium]